MIPKATGADGDTAAVGTSKDKVSGFEQETGMLAVPRRAHHRGRPPEGNVAKQLVSVRLDPDIINHFKSGGPGWQGRLNKALRQLMNQPTASSGQLLDKSA